jgi:glutamyl-Q tRNA(Asp) synthetase
MTIVTRFAPSPTGLLHLGHAFAALTAAAMGEKFLLRIEDIDRGRARPEFTDAIVADLNWLGLAWQEPVLVQSTRGGAYRAALDALAARGLTYPCFCTRSEIAAEIARAGEASHGSDGPVYPGTCRHLGTAEREARIRSGAIHAVRLDAGKAADAVGPLAFTEHGHRMDVEPLPSGDIVLARKDLPAAYHLAVVVDDAHQGVTLVTRGEDLLPATHVQRVLQALLGLPPPDYAHHRLILGANGKKFSKRDGAVTLRGLREAGRSPGEIRASLGF